MSDRITCPRCDHQGFIQKLRIKRLEQEVQVCEECDALWLGPLREKPAYGVDFVDFQTYLAERGVPYNETEWGR